MINPLKCFFGGKQDLINLGFKYFLDTTKLDPEICKEILKKEHPSIPVETINLNFTRYKDLYFFAETQLVDLYKYHVGKTQAKKEFITAILKKYNWVDNPNMEKLYDVCRFNLR